MAAPATIKDFNPTYKNYLGRNRGYPDLTSFLPSTLWALTLHAKHSSGIGKAFAIPAGSCCTLMREF
ncbi:hypothetical protein L6164_009096 [Bauhinia variegata]|uniref:Uncharacterized protein n=1 Tax=Bauhinia variegata TaxID=167791 RepID=A0ACB9PK45_BAUVA|nr:hypothetical protein L6164_009096 [Bauhinia variegata]